MNRLTAEKNEGREKKCINEQPKKNVPMNTHYAFDLQGFFNLVGLKEGGIDDCYWRKLIFQRIRSKLIAHLLK